MENEKQGHYFLQLSKVLQDKSLPSYIAKATKELQFRTYLPTGDFFAMIDDVELLEMQNAIGSIITNDHKEFEILHSQAEKDLADLSLLCFVLALGEGEAEITPEGLQVMLQSLVALTAIEGLYRKGAVEIQRKNFSILDGSRPIARVIDKGDLK